ncbi:hypothetical protein PCYB_002940 [Plasmodium cynomolgi strain B]|uniref:Methyltransferase n=1 Tax=Plasmodium cynomolgi (strain B) TaxID=1120755 RepID=K6V2Q3_PLACD|nr:hypothetical protein PCYB_002940 [Plasmodium cynomolgi strain B]GAB69545.1 hypothetical protein PCYB_002940 [Plasmodium cynomolgi strain B]
MNFFRSIFSDDHNGSLGNGDSRKGVGGATLNGKEEMWGKQICLYKKANKIDLLKKNEFYKSILSEAFNAHDEIFLHLILSHLMSSVLDDQDGRAVSGKSGGMCRGVVIRADSALNSHNDTALKTKLEDAKIIQECVNQLFINEKENNKVVLELGAGSGLDSILLFTHTNIFSNGTNQGANQVVIIDVNPFNLSNISLNVLLNEELFGHLDSAWRSKVKICNIDWTNENTYSCENEQIVTYDYIIGGDLIYDKKIVPSLIHLINFKKNGIFLCV